MKSIVILTLSLALPAAAQILATFEIVETATGNTLGNVVVELQYDKTPQTVANFIGLAEGTRSSYDETTGAVKLKKFYTGESFYRVVDNPGFKIAQTGSGNGTNSGGPGYKFRDEFHPDLRHDPYVLAMANGGPNTNGSQIYLTGSAPIPSLDGKHTVFGIVNATDTDSQGVIDAIIAAGEDGTTVNNVTVERIGAAAEAFDEFGQGLPTCQALPGALEVDTSGGFNNVFYVCGIPLPEASLFRVFSSLDIQSWGDPKQFTAPFDYPVGFTLGIDENSESRKFYNISLTQFPDPIREADLRGRTMVLEGMEPTGNATYTLVFDATFAEATLTKSAAPGEQIIYQYDHNPEAYGASLVLTTPDASQLPLIIVCGYDSETSSEVIGRHSSSEQFGTLRIPKGAGTLTLSK